MAQLSTQQQLIRLLQGAYSGELAAAYAYRGHWKSLKDSVERASVREIEDEEWVHRAQVGNILAALHAAPLRRKEALMWLTGRTLGALCYFSGWFLPMYFAGRLESMNVEEYRDAASYAAKLGLTQHENDLQQMATVEKKHETFFLNAVSNHTLLPLMQRLFKWGKASKQ
jgi:demethoxyubiquinone hydroxylase (CLK1/Coq7/Cat5 family)